MSRAKVLVFAPADEAGETHRKLEAHGCELILGKGSWDTPQGDGEGEMARVAGACDALVGTSIRNAPVSGRVLESSDRLRIVAKYPLRNLGDRVLLSPHMVSNNVGSGLGPGIRWATESVLAALRGEVPDNVYNREVIPRWERRFGGHSVWDTQAR